jgi:GrpB-like predicted nucleotidyltransferase (UPF0157 family)
MGETVHTDPLLDGALDPAVDWPARSLLAEIEGIDQTARCLISGVGSDFHRDRDAELGLPPGVVRLVPHSPSWADLYAAEAALLKVSIGQHIVEIQHVGSTAVRNILAKPIIDILVGVKSLDVAQLLIAPLSAAGYIDLGRDVVPCHHVFGKGMNRSFLLHAVEHQGPAWTRIITFRDALIQDPQLASKYESLKEQLGSQFQNDRPAYASAKDHFIEGTLKRSIPCE